MTDGILQRADHLARNMVPVTITLLLVLLTMVPFGVVAIDQLLPLLPLMAIYHWSIYRPQLMSVFAVFGIGLTIDLLTGSYLGVNTLILLLVRYAVASQRSFLAKRTFWIVWWGFMVVCALALLVEWLLVSALAERIILPQSFLLQYFIGLTVYPLVSALLTGVQGSLMRRA
jgi:rod shape-determining protein MreD